MKIILIGFMGSGKTTVANVLAKKLNLEAIDMDDLILKRSKRASINEIFAKDGEINFRELEIKIGKSLADSKDIVIATSGGVVINKIIIDHLRIKKSKVIFLKTSFSEIQKRLKDINDRPLFKNKINAKKLFAFRQALYKEYADLIVNTDSRSVEEIAYEIISQN